MTGRLQNKRGLITAAASGMGRAGAEMFAAQGASVALADHNTQELEKLVAHIQNNGGKAVALPGDLSVVERAKTIADDAASHLGGLDFVWNHLGHPGPGRVEGMDQEDFNLAVDLNMRSVFATTEAALRYLRQSSGGSILYTASTGGLVGSRYSPIYSAMKHAVVGYMKSLALRVAADGIRVNALCPGPIETPMFGVFGSRPDQPQRSLDEVRQAAERIVPLGRIGQPEEVAHAALFLLSDEASFITGATLAVDGGFTAG
ncbi:MAG: SDR family NAD(P)-dependent oxidoreductase [Alphaproteobacteria bacterium]